MKILVSMIATSKYEDRLKLVQARTIRSKSNQHDVCFYLMAEGDRPIFLDEKFNWINCDDLFISHRVIRGIEIAAEETDNWDYVIFCDDDCVIDIDKFVEQAEQFRHQPTLWTTHPGMGPTKEIHHSLNKHANKFMMGKNVENLFIGFCTTVYNKKLLELVKSNREAVEAIWKISYELFNNKMYTDLQGSILGFLLGAKHIRGHDSHGTCWPAFLSSSLLCRTGNMWHVHGFRETKDGFNPKFKQECLLKMITNAPMQRFDLLESWFSSFHRGFKAKNWCGIKLHMHRHMTPWIGWRLSKPEILATEPEIYFDESTKKINITNTAHELPRGTFDWEACQDGLRIRINSNRSLLFNWYDPEEDAIFGLYENENGLVHDSEIIGIWKKD